MYARKDIPTVLPDAVLRCRKLRAAANVELDQMEKTKFHRINNIEWQQQTFERTTNERHKRWRMYDRAFRLKLKRELGAGLAAALRLRAQIDEEQKLMLEQQLIEKSLATQKKDATKNQLEHQSETIPDTIIEQVAKSNSAYPKINDPKVSIKKGSQSATNVRREPSNMAKVRQSTSAANETSKSVSRRKPANRFERQQTEQNADSGLKAKSDFGSVLFRVLSNIAATPELDDDFTMKKRALEARERRLILTKDDRYFNLIKELVPQKGSNEQDSDNTDVEEDYF